MKATFIGFSCLLIAAATTDLIACSCQTPPLSERINATVIFVGEAIQARTTDKRVTATFEVIESFAPLTVVGSIVATTNGPGGGILYKWGQHYLIYGYRLPGPYLELLDIGWSSGTYAIDGAQDELTYIREWTRKNPYSQNRLAGTLMDSAGKPISNFA